jgi:hypothetical protein
VLAVPLVVDSVDRTTVEFDAAAPPMAPTVAPTAVTPTAEASPTAVATTPPDAHDEIETIGVDDLGAPVLAYGPFDHDPLYLIDGTDERILVSGPVDVAVPDDDGGVVYQPASQSSVRWVNATGDARGPTIDERGQLRLRTVLADGRVVYSVRSDGDQTGEDAVEEFFAVAGPEDGQPELIGTRSAFEAWTLGPATAADGQLVYAYCHLHCRLWPGLEEPAPEAEPLYDGLAIDGLSATPDGRIVGFVEYDHVMIESGQAPQLVLLHGGTFTELARLDLPVQPGGSVGNPTVSFSADGERVLVSLGGSTLGREDHSAPADMTYLVEDALSAQPRVRRVDFAGVVRWFAPALAADAV